MRDGQRGSGFLPKLLLLLLLACSFAGARTIQWFCDPMSVNVTSTGLPLDEDFRFELGVFTAGFTPTAGNTAEWAGKWVRAQRVMYNTWNRLFTGVVNVTTNDAPFTAGAQAYVWGFGGRSGNEWILFRAASWTWPVPDALNPTALQWNAADATAVVGSIHSSGTPSLIAMAQVSAQPPSTGWAQWQGEMLQGTALIGPNDDPDGDGVVNALEYVFGGRPKVADAPPQAVISYMENGGQWFVQGSFPRRSDRPAALLPEVSTNLQAWSSGASFTQTVSSSSGMLTVRSLLPVTGANPRQFLRLKVTVP